MKTIDFYKGKNVFITGHTGFKGVWLSKILINLGANVTGFSLLPQNEENLFDITQISNKMNSIIGDIRNYKELREAVLQAKPEIVFHLAAQPIVKDSYIDPIYTYETNVIGTVNLFEALRTIDTIASIVNVTTDKVYYNNEWCYGYREEDRLDGYDPYSNSKSCSELVTSSYKRSFFNDLNIAVSTARAGNVIGGGDFANHRIIPDCVRAAQNNTEISIRNSYSTRPYQHVLEPLFGYLLIGFKQFMNRNVADTYNIGPDENDCVKTGELVNVFCNKWGGDLSWRDDSDSNAPHEANFLKLDSSKIKSKLGWNPIWNIEEAIEKVCDWTKVYLNNLDVNELMDIQIEEYKEMFKL